MKDLTPVAENDIVLRQREKLNFAPSIRRSEGVDLITEERDEKRRQRYELCLPVANDILEEARSALAVRFRFFDRALWRMPLVPHYDMRGISSDGRCLVYDPVYVIDRFKVSQNEVVRDVVHCLLHCIFKHPFMLYSVLRQPWDVSCDIAIESMLLDLVGEAFPSNMDRRAKESLRVIRAQVGGVITAERLYRWFAEGGNHVDLKSLAPLFFHDSHGLWYGNEEDDRRLDDACAEGARSEDDGAGRRDSAVPGKETEELDRISSGPVAVSLNHDDEAEGKDVDSGEKRQNGGVASHGSQLPGDARSGDVQAEDDSRPQPDDEELASKWDEIGRQIQVDLETHLAQRGTGAGNLAVGLRALHREAVDYADFLRRFSALRECLRTSDDEFDYIYYIHGLSRYGNMPLVEPLEYREDRRVRDFVLAIDTSESCSGELVQTFVRKTYNILKQSESFSDRVNIHIVQCDASIQDDTKITSLEQLELYLENLQIKGFGGTDFRPVFSYVDALIEKGEFSDLRGLVYFTDGKGTFPRRPPKYDVAFAFLDDGYSDPPVPPWAVKAIIGERELRQKDREGRWGHMLDGRTAEQCVASDKDR